MCTLFVGRFNKSPKKGVKYLQDNGLLGPEPDDVAELLHTDERLDKVFNVFISFQLCASELLSHARFGKDSLIEGMLGKGA